MSGMLATGLAAAGKIVGGFAARKAARARARALTNAARNARQEAGVAASIALEDSDRVGARAATLAAASGGGGLQGSALAVIDDLARQGLANARQRVRDGLSQSVALLNDATTAKRQGSLDLFASFVDAGSTVLGQMGSDAQNRRSGDAAKIAAQMAKGG